MEEKILIQSKHLSNKAMAIILLVLCLVVIMVFEAYTVHITINSQAATMSHIYDVNYDKRHATYLEHQALGGCPGEKYGKLCWECDSDVLAFPNKAEYVRYYVMNNRYTCSFMGVNTAIDGPTGVVLWGLLRGVILSAPLLIVFFWLKSYTMVVTNKRVYGRIAFGKRVDIPLDSISAVSTFSLFHGVTVASSSGKISFLLINNSDEMYEQINQLLVERQNKDSKPIEPKFEILQSNADELKKLKELLDMGIITQEEFDTKKKQLLGL